MSERDRQRMWNGVLENERRQREIAKQKQQQAETGKWMAGLQSPAASQTSPQTSFSAGVDSPSYDAVRKEAREDLLPLSADEIQHNQRERTRIRKRERFQTFLLCTRLIGALIAFILVSQVLFALFGWDARIPKLILAFSACVAVERSLYILTNREERSLRKLRSELRKMDIELGKLAHQANYAPRDDHFYLKQLNRIEKKSVIRQWFERESRKINRSILGEAIRQDNLDIPENELGNLQKRGREVADEVDKLEKLVEGDFFYPKRKPKTDS